MFLVISLMVFIPPRGRRDAPVQELRAGDDRLDQAAESVAVGREPLPLSSIVSSSDGMQAASQRVGQQLAAEVVDKFVLPLFVEISAQAVEPVSLAAAGKRRPGVDRAAARSIVRDLADRAVALVRQPDRVEPLVAARAILVGAVAGQRLAQA